MESVLFRILAGTFTNLVCYTDQELNTILIILIHISKPSSKNHVQN